MDWDEEASSYGAVVIKFRVAALAHIPHSYVVLMATTSRDNLSLFLFISLFKNYWATYLLMKTCPLLMGQHHILCHHKDSNQLLPLFLPSTWT
jgi:hypothetical protein